MRFRVVYTLVLPYRFSGLGRKPNFDRDLILDLILVEFEYFQRQTDRQTETDREGGS